MAGWHLLMGSILAMLQLPLKSLLYLLCTRLRRKSVNMCSYPGILPYPAEFKLQQSENTNSNVTLSLATNWVSYWWSYNMLWEQFWKGKEAYATAKIIKLVLACISLPERICYDLISNRSCCSDIETVFKIHQEAHLLLKKWCLWRLYRWSNSNMLRVCLIARMWFSRVASYILDVCKKAVWMSENSVWLVAWQMQ